MQSSIKLGGCHRCGLVGWLCRSLYVAGEVRGDGEPALCDRTFITGRRLLLTGEGYPRTYAYVKATFLCSWSIRQVGVALVVDRGWLQRAHMHRFWLLLQKTTENVHPTELLYYCHKLVYIVATMLQIAHCSCIGKCWYTSWHSITECQMVQKNAKCFVEHYYFKVSGRKTQIHWKENQILHNVPFFF